ncbi:hypothetical protein [Roseovarius sp. M141]|uniref:hypothetical protein n=1 Tax=Roseovarius sp. M141 TaxID=2583806 RepID=UPI0020CFCACD|nr:hypothetical protein [Roseovarius sp. M141]MCQ0092524.1 hypothetical protein [Roseovarius sp. M141]
MTHATAIPDATPDRRPPDLLPQAARLGLAGYPAGLRARAETALRTLAGERLSRDELWTGSDLTGDGFPFELSFAAADPRLRWTFDPAAALPPDRRLPFVLDGLARLGWDGDTGLLDVALPHVPPGGFGAWVGGRHGAAGDDYKAYLEWTDDDKAAQMIADLALPRPPGNVGGLSTRMLALGPGPRREVYYRGSPVPEALVNLLHPVGLAHRADDIRRVIEDSYEHRLRDRLPGGDVGFSYSVDSSGLLPTLTLFFFARCLWGGDGAIRGKMLAQLQAAGADITPYTVASRALANGKSAKTRHGMIALTITDVGHFWGVGLRPATRP